MKSKEQKRKELEEGGQHIKEATSLVFVDFSKTPVKNVTALKGSLRAGNNIYRVIKKRLVQRVLNDAKMEVDTKQFGGQLGTIFSPQDISEVTGTVYKFAKEAEKSGYGFKVLGGYDVTSGTYFAKDEIQRIGQLPSRTILLSQLVGMMQAPVRSLAYVLQQIADKGQQA